VVLGLGWLVISWRLIVVRRIVDPFIRSLPRVERVFALDHVAGRFRQLRLVRGELNS
jgi:hypothetical protein